MKRLNVLDAVIAFALAMAGGLLIPRIHYPSLLAAPWTVSYVSHGWFLVLPLFWLWVLRRPFPIGHLTAKELRGWTGPFIAILLVSILFHAVIYRHGMADFIRSSTGAAFAWLFFQGIWVGLTEEFLFRGLIQTALTNTFSHTFKFGNLQMSVGALVSACVFGGMHLMNASYQPWSFTLMQVGFATLFGLFISYGYEKTRNLWGAVILHNLSDLTFFLLPLLLG